MTSPDYESVLAYHEATKHDFYRYARSAGTMDWANQPNPFRYYEGAEKIPLPLTLEDPGASYGDLHSPAQGMGQPLTEENLSSFLLLSMGLSAWKKAGSGRWSLRTNPSSGNLHPTETHLAIPPVKGMGGGVFHYACFDHLLERRIDLPQSIWPQVESHFGGPGFLVVLSSIFWRESWKYGERAYRYCCLDAGHAAAALSIAARMYGWESKCLVGAADRQIGTLLGFDRVRWHPLEEEVPEMVLWISLGACAQDPPSTLPDNLVQYVADRNVEGVPNRLSRKPVDWSIIYGVSHAAEKLKSEPDHTFDEPMPPIPIVPKKKAADVIRQRRSATSFDPRKRISPEAFCSILGGTLSRAHIPPFGMNLMPPCVDLLLFVHRVDGIAPGLYLLARRAGRVNVMQDQMKEEFLWQPAHSDLPLFRLQEMDATHLAMELSCHQEIARDSAFAVAMVAEFENKLRKAPYRYRHLHWECGMIGQMLYLGAEAHGIGGTGIGCFFDDPVHQLLGIEGNGFQSLYHFTVGHPVEDTRLETLAPYHHLDLAGR